MTEKQLIVDCASTINLQLNDIVSDKLCILNDHLLQVNQHINLTAIRDSRESIIKHLFDSLSLFKTGLLEGEKSVIDVGTGAGFPGIVLKIFNDNLNVTFLDSTAKKLNFVKESAEMLGLSGTNFLAQRAEDAAKTKEHRQKYDIATARAVAALPVLLEYCTPFVKVGGYFLAMKGKNAEKELEDSQNALKELCCEYVKAIDIPLPETDAVHHILIFRKTGNTSTKYPRIGAKIKKLPL